MKRSFNVIAVLDCKRGIGREGKLPWHVPSDLQYFHDMTANSVVIMGRKTWDSIPMEYSPLPNRINIVLSRNKKLDLPDGVLLSDSLEKALAIAGDEQDAQRAKQIFVIGGAEIYKLAISHADCVKLFLTHIEAEFDCDVFFPQYENQFELSSRENTQTYEQLQFAFCQYKRKR